jgi:hypothetical protein
MNRIFLVPLLLFSAITCQAGYVDINQTSYTSDMFISVTDNDSSQVVGAGDIITTVQLFNYTDFNSLSKTAIVISRLEVLSNASKTLSFQNEVAQSLTSAVAGFTNSSGIAGLDATDTSGDLSWVMLTADGTQSLSGSNFDFGVSNFGLTTSDWTIDATGTLVYQQYKGNGAVASLTTEYPDPSQLVNDGDGSGYNQRFAFDLTAVRDNTSEPYFDTGSSVGNSSITKFDTTSVAANIGTTASFGINYGYAGTSPSGTNFSSSAVAVNLADISSVPEPSTLLVFSALGFGGIVSRRRRV